MTTPKTACAVMQIMPGIIEETSILGDFLPKNDLKWSTVDSEDYLLP